MSDLLSLIAHYVEYAPGVAVMIGVLWRIDQHAKRVIDSCVKCWDKDQQAAHNGGKSMDNPK